MFSAKDLEQFPIFQGLDQSLLSNIAKICSKRTYPAGEVCVAEGAMAEFLFLLVEGEVRLERKLPQKWLEYSGEGQRLVHTLKPKHIFGWSSIVEPGVHTATARCSQETEVVVINGKELLKILDNQREESYIFMKRLATVIALRLLDTSNALMHEMADFAAYRSM